MCTVRSHLISNQLGRRRTQRHVANERELVNLSFDNPSDGLSDGLSNESLVQVRTRPKCLPSVRVSDPNIPLKLQSPWLRLEVLHQLRGNLHFNGRLDLLDAVWLLRLPDTQPVVCEDRVSCFERGLDVVVFRTLAAEGPVRVVEVDSVGVVSSSLPSLFKTPSERPTHE